MLIIFLLIAPSTCQFSSYLSLRLRLSGRCNEGDFDCGLGHCIPVRKFHDGRVDCLDGSDEWCLLGQMRCGAYCVDFKDSLGCIFNPKCDGSTRQPKFCEITKEKLCRDPQAFPCKGYGECVLWPSLMDGRPDCIDGSDEDAEYVRSLERPFRCYFNRTGQLLPAVINYSKSPSLPQPVAPILTTPPPRLPLVPAIPPLCARCPPPLVFPALPGPPTHLPSFPTLLPANQPDSQLPISPLASYSTISPVQIQHITPISVTQSEPGYGDFFPGGGSATASSTGYPPVVDFTVEAHINTVLPPTSSPSSEELTTSSPLGWTTDASAHIKVIPSSGEGSSGEPTHIDLGTGEISGQVNTPSPATSTAPPAVAPSPPPTTAPRGPADGIFFPLPVRPIPNGPVAIRPIPPFGGFNTLRPIVPEMTSPGPVQFITPEPGQTDHLIPIHPGIAVPTSPGERATTPKNPFDEDYGGDFFGTEGPTGGPTVQVGVIGGASTLSPTDGPTTAEEAATSAVAPEEGESQETTESTTTEEPSTTIEVTTTILSETVASVGSESTKEATCPSSLLDPLKEKYPSPFCHCDFDIKEKCDRSKSTIFRVDKTDICKGDSSINDEDKARVVLSMMSNGLPYTSCIDSNTDDGIIVSTNCSDCSLQLIQSKVEGNNKEAAGMHFEALNGTICDSDFNNCHRYAVCVVDPSGLRFHCVCKEGTEDHSDGRGLDCFGFPAEDDCLLIFGVCLIVWLLFLLGFLFCCPLIAYLCYRCSDRYQDNVVHPVTPAVKTVKSGTSTPALSARVAASNGSGTAMASVLVDALRNNAKGMTAVSHSMASRVRFTDEVTAPPGVVDSRPLPEKPVEPPPQSIMKTGGMTQSSSEPKLSLQEKMDPLSGITAMEYLIKQGSPVITPRDKADTPGETPILEQIRTPIDTSRGTPPHEKVSVHSLPIPTIEVPGPSHKTSVDLGQIPSLSQPTSPTPIVVKADVHQEKGDTHSVVSVGIQPTIWETYRAVGLVGDDHAREDSSSSLDDLIGKKFESRPATSAPVEKPIEAPVPKLDLVSSPNKEIPPSLPPLDPVHSPPAEPSQRTPVSVARKKSAASVKLAEMLGVTLVDDQNDMQALTDMAEKRIDLPLEPIPPNTSLTSKIEESLMSLEPIIQKTPEDVALEAAILREKMEEEKKKDEASQVSAHEEEKEDLKKVAAEMEPETSEKFVPKAARKTPPRKTPAHLTIPPRRRAPDSSTESSSDAEMALRRRMGREPNPFKDKKRRYRRPERQLSSISEKSAEIAGDAAISESSPDDFTVSLPNTTRSLSDWHAYIPRYKRFDASATEDTDMDIPHRYKKQPIVSSPDIPDVSVKRSQERLDMLESGRGKKVPIKQVPSKLPPGGSSSSAAGSKPFLPQLARKTTSRSSVDSRTRASAVSRKIASRKTEMRPAKSASDLMVEEEEIRTGRGLVSKRHKIARSEEYLHGRPPWDISPYREGDERPLPPIHQRSSYSMRATHVSPALKKRTGSHTSLRSGSSVSFSPYFDPRDPTKPPKEELWWTPRDS